MTIRCVTDALHVSKLRCNAANDPLAVSEEPPLLSWVLASNSRCQEQTAYQIMVATRSEALSNDHADLWDTGKLLSSETFNVEYAGKPLTAIQRSWWKVRVWDQLDRVSAWSAPAMFGSGLKPADWTSEWVGFDAARDLDLPLAPFDGAKWVWLDRKITGAIGGVFVCTLDLPLDAVVEHAEMALSVAGSYSFYWANEQFGMSDGQPLQWQRPYIRDLTERLHAGPNRFVIKAERVGDEPGGVLFKIVAHTADGRQFTMVSDAAWRATEVVADDWRTGGGAEAWPRCECVAEYGEAPWGRIRGIKNFLPPPAYLRGTFRVSKPVRHATLFATAFGWYDAYLNGQRINDSYFDPGWTDYRKRLYYRAYDVSDRIRPGENAIGVILADGWFSGYIGWCHQRDLYGKHPRFRGELHIEFADGTTQIVRSDSTWKASLGPILEADILMGEAYDARRELGNWSRTGYEDSAWKPVSIGALLNPALQPHPAPPVVALMAEQFKARSIVESAPGQYIIDLGQNFAGVVRLKVRDAKAGQKIRLRFGERLNSDGTLYTINLRTARATDYYTCRGDAEETWSPRFTFHGFQYVELTGFNGKPDIDTIVGVPLSTDAPIAGYVDCSDQLANQLASNVYWSQRSNFIEIPTDCPQRDERLGWCDAAQSFVGAAVMRADVQTFYNKWATDLDDAQRPDGQFPWLAPLLVATPEVTGPMWESSSPAWMDAGIICPWSIYEYYGDRRQLGEHYPQMVRQIEWYVNTSGEDLLPPPNHKCLSDWLHHHAPTPDDVFRQAFFIHSTDLVARAAAVLGKTDDAARLGRLAADLRRAFAKAFVDPVDGKIMGDTQACYALAIHFNLLDASRSKQAAEHLVANLRARDWVASTGMEATLPMMLALAKIGRNDLAYRLLHAEAFPSWNFSIKNGATTLWERWDSWTPQKGFGDANMNSFNHFSFGAVFQWMAENIGGIRNGGDAFKHIMLAPTPGGNVTHATASYQSVRGLIAVEWSFHNGVFSGVFIIPANTGATVVLPGDADAIVTEAGRPLERALGVSHVRHVGGRFILHCRSGRYEFKVQPPASRDEALGTSAIAEVDSSSTR